MKQGPRYHVKPRRHRNGRTDYRRRLSLLQSKKPRISIRKSLKYIRVQFIEYSSTGDKVLVSVISKDLMKKYHWKFSTSSTPAAYLTGLMAGQIAKEKGIKEGIFDIGRYPATPGSKLFATVKGVIDTGIVCPYNEKMFPSEERLIGKHLNKEIQPIVTKIKSNIIGGK